MNYAESCLVWSGYMYISRGVSSKYMNVQNDCTQKSVMLLDINNCVCNIIVTITRYTSEKLSKPLYYINILLSYIYD